MGNGPSAGASSNTPAVSRYNRRCACRRFAHWGSSPLLPVSILSLLIQAALIVHVIKTGRNTLWILAIGFLPGIGSLAYVVAEGFPDPRRGRTARRAKNGIGRSIRPH